jgi:hypothetical protein
MSFFCLFTSKRFCKASNYASHVKTIPQIGEGMSKICLFQMKGGHGHDVGWHIWPIWILKLKIFRCHSMIFSLPKGFVKLQMAHPMQKKLLKSMKEWTKYAFSTWRGSQTWYGWHIWLVWILELNIFGCHSIVFALQKGFVKLQMSLFKTTKNKKDMKFENKGDLNVFFPLWTSSSSSCFFVFGVPTSIVNFHLVHLWSWNIFQKDKKVQKYGKGLVIGVFTLSISYVILT